MPDDLASLISGTDPMAPLELRALQQQQLLQSARDASQWANQGPFGALARTIAGFAGGPAQSNVAQIAAAKAAANPQIFQALASGNPYQWGANNPQAGPIALQGVLANAPSAIEAQYKGIQALMNANTLRSLGAGLPGVQPQSPGTAAPTISSTPAPSSVTPSKPGISPPAQTSDVTPLLNGILATPPGAPAPPLSSQQRIAIINAVRNNPALLGQLKARFAASPTSGP